MTITEAPVAGSVHASLLETAAGGVALVVDADEVRIGATCIPEDTVGLSISNNLGLAVVVRASGRTYVALAAPADKDLAQSEAGWLGAGTASGSALGLTAQLFVVPEAVNLATAAATGPSADAIVRLITAARSTGVAGSTGIGSDILET